LISFFSASNTLACENNVREKLRKNNRKILKAKTQKGSYQVDRNQMPMKNRKKKGLPLTEVVEWRMN
jgi:hypothetical protein